MRNRRKAVRARLTRMKYFSLLFAAVPAIIYAGLFVGVLAGGPDPILLVFVAAGVLFYGIAGFCLKNVVPKFDGRDVDDPMNY